MKPITNNLQSVQSSGIQQSVNFGIKSSGLHHILGILRNQLYSDKVLAVIREYTCNAHDAHIQAGCSERPIEVTIPTKLSPVFKVRDFGDALSEKEIQDVYAFYGESTKRNTNDQIGMLGIGSKAAFAYGDNYVINSYLDGKKYIYNAFIDPSQIGQISKIGEEDTNEENGIEIVVPVNESDCDEFQEKSCDLFKWFNVTPNIKGCSQFSYDKEFLFEGKSWAWLKDTRSRYDRGDAILVMGNIGYPIDTYALGDMDTGDEDLDRRIDQMICASLVIRMDIGDVEISASREKLQYTDYTKKNIKDKLKTIADELVSTISKQFKDCKTLWDCKCLLGEVFDMGSSMYALRDLVAKKMKFNGKKIGEARVSKWLDGNMDSVDLRHWEKGYRSARYSCKETNHIDANRSSVIIENDLGHRRGITGRILPLIYNKEQKPYLINFNSAKEKKSWLKVTGFDGKMVKLSSLPQHKLSEFSGYETTTGGSGYDKNKKHSAKCFELDFGAEIARWHSKKSDHWKIADLDVENESGIYVIIDKFQVEKPDDSGYATHVDPKQIKNLKEVTDQCGIKFPKHIYAFKTGQRKKIEGKDGWTELHTWAKQEIEKVIEDNDLHQAWIDIQKVDELNEYKHNSDRYYGSKCKEQIQNLKKLKLVAPNGVMGDFIVKHGQMKHSERDFKQIKAIQSVASEYGVKFSCPKNVKPTYDIKGLYDKMLEKYDMLPLLDRQCWTYEWNSKTQSTLENYVNVIDVCEQSSNTN
jgi:hypothetical protein